MIFITKFVEKSKKVRSKIALFIDFFDKSAKKTLFFRRKNVFFLAL